jgi:NADPH:quinone reductase-like Zn-dependent oxidoreductase
MMHAVVLEEFGGALTLAEVGKPAAGPGQVLVRVAASGVNPLDTKIAAGAAASKIVATSPSEPSVLRPRGGNGRLRMTR